MFPHLYSCLHSTDFGTGPNYFTCVLRDHSVYVAENGMEAQRTGKSIVFNNLLKYSWKELIWSSPGW